MATGNMHTKFGKVWLQFSSYVSGHTHHYRYASQP